MNTTPSIQRACRVFELLGPRLERLNCNAWLCSESGEVLRSKIPSGGNDIFIAEMEQSLESTARAAYNNPHCTLIPLAAGRWGTPLLFGPRGAGAGLIFAVPVDAIDERAANQLAAMLRWMFADLCKLVQDDQTLGQFSDKLAQAYEETNLLFRLARMLNCVKEPDAVLGMVCGQMREVMPFGWLAMKFSSCGSDVPQLQGRLLAAGDLPAEPNRFAAAADALLASYRGDDWTRLLPADGCELGRLAGGDVLAEPITHDDQIIGVLLAGGKQGEDSDFTSGEMQFMDAAADFLGIFHENLSRFAEQRAMFMGTLKALTSSIDAKDPYTCGHSERVALLTRQLASTMGMSDKDIETYYVAGLVHDVGKIGVPETVLCKCGRLDDAEFAQIKRHPEIGHRILKDIPAMQAMLPGVLHHHERWDGRGYPHGLAGEQIPLMARVITFADTFDAMSSNRSYRAALPREKIIAEIRRCAGTQFDPSLVETFLGLDFTEFDRMLSCAAVKAAA